VKRFISVFFVLLSGIVIVPQSVLVAQQPPQEIPFESVANFLKLPPGMNFGENAGVAVDLVTTDGFLLPNRVLEERGLLARKGFPESYDVRRLLRFVADLKAGAPEVSAPVYSHLIYDILPGEAQLIRQPDILILEGLNVLEGGGRRPEDESRPFVSDYFDFSIYVDSAEQFIKQWFLLRFRRLRQTAFRDPQSYFRKYAQLSEAEAEAFAGRVWEEINGANLRENILPTRERAHLILEKAADHRVERVRLIRERVTGGAGDGAFSWVADRGLALTGAGGEENGPGSVTGAPRNGM